MMEKPRCINQCQAVFVCIDQKCVEYNPFICRGCKQNKCEHLHSFCIMKNWLKYKNQLDDAIKISNNQFTKATQKVQRLIKCAKIEVQNELNCFNVWKQQFTISKIIKQMTVNLQEHKQSKWTGKNMSKFIKEIQEKTDKIRKQFGGIDSKRIEQVETKILDLKRFIKKLYLSQKQEVVPLLMPPPPVVQSKLFNWKFFEDIKSSQIQKKQKITPVVPVVQNKPPEIKTVEQIVETINYIKIKQYDLEDVNEKILGLKEKPTHIQIKVKLKDYISLYFEKLQKSTYLIIRCLITIKKEYTHTFIRKIVQLNFSLQMFIIYNSEQKNNNSDRMNIYQRRRIIEIDLEQKIIDLVVLNNQIRIIFYKGQILRQYEEVLSLLLKLEQKKQKVDVEKFAKLILRNQALTKLRFFTLYWPYSLGDNDLLKYEQAICESLMTLPKLEQCTIICNGILSKNGFKGLEGFFGIFKAKFKFNTINEPQWFIQQWNR